jgi:hypothetical protein
MAGQELNRRQRRENVIISNTLDNMITEVLDIRARYGSGTEFKKAKESYAKAWERYASKHNRNKKNSTNVNVKAFELELTKYDYVKRKFQQYEGKAPRGQWT